MGKIKQHKVINNRTDFYYYMFRNILLVSLPFLIISTVVLSRSSIHSFATTSGSDNLSLTLSTSCTINSILAEPHTISMGGGQYEDEIGSTRINAYCNDGNGYGIYAIGSSGDTDGNTDLINNADDHYNIHTGIYDSNNITASTPSSWSMKLTAGTGSGIDASTGNSIPLTPPTIMNNYDSYNIVPNNYTLVAKRTSGTNMTIDTDVTGSYFTTTYAIYATNTQPAGTYNGKVKYVMVHPNSNNSNTIPDLKAAFAAAGKQPAYQNENGYYYAMQDMTSDICNSVTRTGEVTAMQLVDIRDNNLYWVAKLADNKCWMTQNLDLDLVVAYTDVLGQEVMKSLTSEDTDLTDHSLTGAYSQANGYSYDESTGIITWIPASTAKTINFEGTTVTGWQNRNTEPYSANKTDDTNTVHASLGNYYNWTAAIASNDSSTLTSNTIDDISQNPQNSICPKGWRLPTISNESGLIVNSTNEFTRLNYLYNNNSTSNDQGLISEPLYFMYSGIIDVKSSNTLISLGSLGLYISSTNYGNRGFYGIRFQNNGVAIEQFNNDYDGKQSGFSVRCVTR